MTFERIIADALIDLDRYWMFSSVKAVWSVPDNGLTGNEFSTSGPYSNVESRQ
jgi:hypothetical protein